MKEKLSKFEGNYEINIGDKYSNDIKTLLSKMLIAEPEKRATIEELTSILEISKEELKELIISLREDYEHDDRGIRLSILGNAFKLTTKKEHRSFYEKLLINESLC